MHAAQQATALSAGAVLAGAGSWLRESFFMFWDTAWALILGFGLSGAVQAFVPREGLRARLGDHRPAAVARASAAGALSSSCSYAASAMARSLFAKGADFVTSLIFMFASTNLVIELGIVLVVLIGWQFAAAEYIGGAIMIILLALLGSVFLAGRRVQAARSALTAAGTGPAGAHGAGAHGAGAHEAGAHEAGAHEAGAHEAGAHEAGAHEAEEAAPTWRAAIRTRSGWADAAAYTVADLTMLRREMVVGFLAAGLLAVAVPAAFWNAFFLSGHGIWTSIENAIVGPFIALISFVCSIGNVPLAAALWHGGISFGGVISFIFADLIALPLVLIYRKFYGTALALRMLAVFWAVMAVAGLLTELIFTAAGLVPAHRPARIVPEQLTLNYTTLLNIAFLAIFGVLFWLHRNRERLGGGTGYAIDPVCGMQVEKASAPARSDAGGGRHWFCSDRCRERFESDQSKSAAPTIR